MDLRDNIIYLIQLEFYKHISFTIQKREKISNFYLRFTKENLLNECVKKLLDCDIVLFSSYVWNEKISLKIAEELKKIDPNKLIIFGGPSVPDNIDNKTGRIFNK